MKPKPLRSHLIVISAAFVLLSCSPKQEELDSELWISKGQQQLLPFKKQLMGALSSGMEKGPEVAIEVCKLQAPAIAASVATENAIIGRTTTKTRNSDNAAKEWMKPLLDYYSNHPDEHESKVVRIDKQTVGYVEPIFVKSMCLNCHGSEIAPSIASQLDKDYPEDKAKGYSEGDFRGLFWIEFQDS